MVDLQTGQLAPREQRFCPYGAITKWPYKHLHGEVRRVVSDNYFAFGIFKTHGWHIYYIHTLLDTAQKPLLLVPEKEVQTLFDKITKELEIGVSFPSVTEEPGFQLEFLEEGIPRPRYLGMLTEDNDIATLEDIMPVQGSAAEEHEKLDESSFPMFRRYMQLALEASKQKSKAVRDKRKLDRVDIKKKRCAELKRTQCYLGVRKRENASEEIFTTSPNTSWEESQKAQDAYDIAAGITTQPLNVSLPAPYDFYRAPVFICVDIEVWEMDHRKLTEIGVCTLDTQDLINLAPGEKGQDWIKQLRCRHFRILENAHLNNTEYVSGCADRFEFGKSEWILVKDAPYVLASCFKAPFSEPGKYTPFPTDPKQASAQALKSKQLNQDPPGEKRSIILVGHEIGSDIGYMRSAGYDVGNLPNLIEAIDTTVLFRAYKHEQNPRNLGAVLLELGMTGWNLHNAGNDATYTLRVLLAISIASLSSMTPHPSEPPLAELESAEAVARERIREDYEEWSLAEAEGGDGGDPVALLPWSEAQQKAAWDKGMKTAEKAEEKREKKNARGFVRSRGDRRGGGNFRGGRGSEGARGGGGVPAKKHGAEMRTLDMDTMDEAIMGSVGGGAHASGEEPRSAWQDTSGWNDLSDAQAGVTVSTQRTAEEYMTKSSYLPPHLRHRERAAHDEIAGSEVSEKTAARLKMLDLDG